MLHFRDSVSPLSRLRAMLCFHQHPMMSPAQLWIKDKDTSGLDAGFYLKLVKREVFQVSATNSG